jgi:hypothetical protein
MKQMSRERFSQSADLITIKKSEKSPSRDRAGSPPLTAENKLPTIVKIEPTRNLNTRPKSSVITSKLSNDTSDLRRKSAPKVEMKTLFTSDVGKISNTNAESNNVETSLSAHDAMYGIYEDNEELHDAEDDLITEKVKEAKADPGKELLLQYGEELLESLEIYADDGTTDLDESELGFYAKDVNQPPTQSIKPPHDIHKKRKRKRGFYSLHLSRNGDYNDIGGRAAFGSR